MSKVICISGGGNRGAAGAGKIAKMDENFDVAVGVSTGALLTITTLLREHGIAKKAYTRTTNEDIFDVNPFDKNGKIKPLKLAWRVILGKETFGDSRRMLDTIRSYITPEMYREMKRMGKTAIVGVYNLSMERIEYKSSDDHSYEDFTEWMWASSSVPPVMSWVEKEGFIYEDGGVQEGLPMEYASQFAQDLTVVAHRPETIPDKFQDAPSNALSHAKQLIWGLRKSIINDDLKIGIHAAHLKGLEPEVHYVAQGYGGNELSFDPYRMGIWYNDAYREALNPVEYPLGTKS